MTDNLIWSYDLDAAPRDGTTLLLKLKSGVQYIGYSDVDHWVGGKFHIPVAWCLMPKIEEPAPSPPQRPRSVDDVAAELAAHAAFAAARALAVDAIRARTETPTDQQIDELATVIELKSKTPTEWRHLPIPFRTTRRDQARAAFAYVAKALGEDLAWVTP